MSQDVARARVSAGENLCLLLSLLESPEFIDGGASVAMTLHGSVLACSHDVQRAQGNIPNDIHPAVGCTGVDIGGRMPVTGVSAGVGMGTSSAPAPASLILTPNPASVMNLLAGETAAMTLKLLRSVQLLSRKNSI